MHGSYSSLEIIFYATSPIDNICKLMKQVAILATKLLVSCAQMEQSLKIQMFQSFVPYKDFFKIFN